MFPNSNSGSFEDLRLIILSFIEGGTGELGSERGKPMRLIDIAGIKERESCRKEKVSRRKSSHVIIGGKNTKGHEPKT